MSANPAEMASASERLGEEATCPRPVSRKIFVQGSRDDLRIGMREIALEKSPTLFGGEDKPPITMYDPQVKWRIFAPCADRIFVR